ncbi:hypothetical protein T484DRAFT_1880905 [Baffinella frigidus]|nr:hypothetical protein T484DRAFT_1880905 [Cryptophyta sp. CCMP2293]
MEFDGDKVDPKLFAELTEFRDQLARGATDPEFMRQKEGENSKMERLSKFADTIDAAVNLADTKEHTGRHHLPTRACGGSWRTRRSSSARRSSAAPSSSPRGSNRSGLRFASALSNWGICTKSSSSPTSRGSPRCNRKCGTFSSRWACSPRRSGSTANPERTRRGRQTRISNTWSHASSLSGSIPTRQTRPRRVTGTCRTRALFSNALFSNVLDFSRARDPVGQ